MAENPGKGKGPSQLDASGGQGLQIGEGNEQVNQYISTYVERQVIEGQHGSSSNLAARENGLIDGNTARSGRPGTFSLRPPLGNLPVRVRGRDQLIKSLQDRLLESPDYIQVLHGLGGCGKTTIALALARHAREHGYSVYWVSGTGEDRLTTGMREVARELGARDEEINDAWTGVTSAMDLMWRYLDSSSMRWLLVIDNADDPTRLAAYEGAPGDGTGWARPSSRGLTVVTTRVGSSEIWGQNAERHIVNVLDPDDAGEVLIDLAGQAGTADEARDLAARLGGLPLALRLAGSYLARASRGAGVLRHRHRGPSGLRTFVAYAAALGDLGTDLLDEGAFTSAARTPLEHVHRDLVSRTWEISLDLLHEQGLPEARIIMRLISCFAATPFPVDLIDMSVLSDRGLLPDATTAVQVERAIEALVDFSLLDVSVVSDTVCLVAHRLVLEANAHWLNGASSEDQALVWDAAAGVLGLASNLAPELPPNWTKWRLLTPHIWAAVLAVPNSRPDLTSQVVATGLTAFAYLWFSGNYEDAISLVDTTLMRSEELDADSTVRLAVRDRYALARLDGEDEIREFSDVLEAYRRLLGDEHPETLITRHNLAMALATTGDLAEAEEELRAVLEMRRHVLGPADPYTLVTQSAVASIMTRRGHSDEADAEYMAMIRHLESTEQIDHRFVPLEARHKMAHIMDKAKNFTDAEAEYRSLLSQLEDLKAVDSMLYRNMTVCLGRNLRSQRRYSDALVEMDQALILFTQASEQENNFARILGVRHERGDILRHAGQHGLAEAEIRAVLQIRRQSDSEQDSIVLQERHCLAHTLEAQGKNTDSHSEMREIIAIYESLLDMTDKPVRTTRWCYGRMLQKQNLWFEAEQQFQVVLAAETLVLGADDTDILESKFRLAQVRYAGKMASKQETLAIYDTILAKLDEIGSEGQAKLKAVREERDRLMGNSSL